MYTVGRIGSYISRGVSNVSSPFHPFGGAVDIIVVKQPDGSFKTSPWYVQLGKFQGVLKAKERTLSINVNGVEADFHMYLDNKGEAYFVREVDEQEGPSGSNSSSLGCDTDGESNRGQIFEKTKSFNFLSEKGRSVSDPEVANKKMHKIFGLLVKSRSAKENGFRQSAHRMDREGSLERAEMAARLLEVKWSTNLDTKRSKKCDASGVLNLDLQDRGQCYAEEGDTLARKDCHHDEDQSPASSSPKNYMDTFTLEETYLELKLVPDRSRPLNQPDGKQTNHAEVSKDIGTGKAQESSLMDSFVLHSLELKSNKNGFSCGEEQRDTLEIMEEAAKESGAERVQSYMCCETSGSFIKQVVLSSGGSSCKNVHFSCLTCKKLCGPFQSDCFPTAPRCNGDSTIVPCTLNRCIDSRDSNDCCDSLEGSREVMGENGSASAMETITASSDVEPYLITEVDEEKKSSNQKISITNPSILDEHAGPDPRQKEGLSENRCPPLSSTTLSLRADNKDKEYYEVAFLEPKTTGIDASMIPEVEQFLMEGLYLSEHQKIELGESIGVDSTGKEVQLKGWSESSEIMADDTNDVVEDPEFVRGNSRQADRNHLVVSQTLSIPSGTGRAYNDVDDRGQTAQSAPSLWSSENEMDVQGVNHFPSCSAGSNSGAFMLMHNDIPSSLEEEAAKKQQSTLESARLEDSKITEEIKRILSEPAVELSLCGHLLSEGMGYEAASCAFHAEKLDKGKLTCIIGPDLIKDTRLIVRIGGLYFPWDAAVRIVSMIGSSEQIFEPEGMIAIDLTEKGSEGDPEKSSDPLRSKSKLGLFSTNKSNSMMDETETIPLGAGNSPDGMQKETDITQETMSSKKKVIKTKVPTSEQLASLNLKEGKNTVTFTFSTPMLGEQKVDARIFLWKWNARIVISDVDGTITKSDVLGQFMPLMGYDWSQTGVAHLFSAIKENGYELLFLSARAISQAYHTRQFLINLKQDGKALPEGPVCISPDGLFPSLFREVIRRAPHEFKIQCLEDIKALFPPGYNPFYAGFGNRITDEISYLKVGIPNGKIFIINPKGQVAVQRRVDTKSYSCLHNIVHDMFPPTSSTSGNEQEDYNSWNFWRLPPSDIL